MENIFDCIIIGGGPAALSAGVYAGRGKMRTLIVEKGNGGGQAATTSEIVNYPGIRSTTGPNLVNEMRLHAEDFGVEFMNTEVTGVDFSGDIKVVHTKNGELKAVSVVIATGAVPRKLGFPGESEFTGRGVAYCSTCDGEFFEGLEVFVVGAGFAAAEEAMYLTRFATKVTVIAREPEFTCPPSIAEKVKAHPKVEVHFNTEVVEATGDDMLRHAKFINNVTKETWEFAPNEAQGTFGIFVFVGYQPQTDLFRGHVEMDKWGYILTNEQNMETSVKGVYAVGDLRPKMLRQVITAVSDGAIAGTALQHGVEETKERLNLTIEQKPKTKAKEEPKKENVATEAVGGPSKLLNDGLRTQLKGIFAKMESKVTLVTVVDPSMQKSVELRDLVLDIANLGEKIEAKVVARGADTALETQINADKFPVVALVNESGEYSGIKFHGVPGGHELNSFILAIYNLAGPGQALDENVRTAITGLTKKRNVKVMVSLSCHYCPDVVASAQRIATLNGNIEAEMVDIASFPELKTQYKVMSVPAMIIDNEQVVFGAKKIDEIIDVLK
ncbi:MAG: FAD-dependent oxidoreductase [Bacilli bacterium]